MYKFWLEGVVDCPEFLVNLDVLKWFVVLLFFLMDSIGVISFSFIVDSPFLMLRVASQFGLELIAHWNFHDFYTEHIQDEANRRLFRQMRVVDNDGIFPAAQWEVASFYLAFVFRKKSV
jgi:hypothetical protein